MLKKFKIYRSSAGSGKTYTLTRAFVTLALRHPNYFKKILAVTFTNKATEEMKGRIIETLHSLSISKDKEGEFKNIYPNVDIKQRASEVLSSILHQYSYLSVDTIDSFFQQVIKSFAREIGIHGGYKLELDTEKVIDEVVEQMLAQLNEDTFLTKWLVDYSLEKLHQNKSWDIRKEIKSLSREVFKETYHRSKKKTALVGEKKEEKKFYSELQSIIQSFENQLSSYGSEALKIIEDNNLEAKDFSYGMNGVIGYFIKIKEKKSFEPGKRALDAITNTQSWCAKSSPNKETIEQLVTERLNPILQSTLTYYQNRYSTYQSAKAVASLFHAHTILTHVTEGIDTYRKENDIQLITDTPIFLKEIIEENDTPFIYEKMGAVFRHFLIDEFQDTSGFQWDNFKPLIFDSLSQGHDNMIVGDIKQSIYRWRGGDWQLLLNKVEKDIGQDYVENIILNKNWRSGKNIVAFNNDLFSKAPTTLQAILSEQMDEADLDIKKHLIPIIDQSILAYEEVKQEYTHTISSPGYVKVGFVDNEENISWKEKVLLKIPLLLEELQDKGYAAKDLTILVRRKVEGEEIVKALQTYKKSKKAKKGYNYELVSSESLFLESASVVKILIYVLRYLNEPQDIVNLANLAYDYQKVICDNKNLDLHHLFSNPKNFIHHLPDLFNEKEDFLRLLPLYELTEELISIFSLNTQDGEYAYIETFQESILNFSKEQKPDIQSFLAWWDTFGKLKSIKTPENQNATRIETIHKSKGLQYKIVLIPFCNWSLDHETHSQQILWTSSEKKPYDQLPTFPLKYGKPLANSFFDKEYYTEKTKIHLDNLNLLYVAFTRAEDVLYAFCQSQKENYKINDISSLLYDTLRHHSSWNQESTSTEVGNILKQTANKDTPVKSTQDYTVTSWRDKLSIRKKAKEFFIETENKKSHQIGHGILLHEVMAEIKIKEDIKPVIKRFIHQGKIDPNEAIDIQNQVEKLINNPSIRPWFDNNYDIKTEVSIVSPTGNHYRLDRVMIKDKKAIIVDYKSTAKSKDSKQIKRYMNLLSDMGYHPVEGHFIYLDDTKTEKVT